MCVPKMSRHCTWIFQCLISTTDMRDLQNIPFRESRRSLAFIMKRKVQIGLYLAINRWTALGTMYPQLLKTSDYSIFINCRVFIWLKLMNIIKSKSREKNRICLHVFLFHLDIKIYYVLPIHTRCNDVNLALCKSNLLLDNSILCLIFLRHSSMLTMSFISHCKFTLHIKSCLQSSLWSNNLNSSTTYIAFK